MADATILDTFIVKLGFDTESLKKHSEEVDASLKKTRESMKKTGDEVEKSGNNAAGAIDKLRNQALALFAVFTGGRGLKEFVEGMTNADSALGRFSASLGLAPARVSQWEGAARLAGASAASIDGAIRSLTLAMEELDATGSTAVIPWLRSLGNASGIDLVHTRGKTVLEEMKNIAEASRIMIQKGGDPAQATYWLQNLGIAPDLIPLFERGGKALEEYLNVAKQYAATQKDIEASGERTFVFNRLALSLERLGRNVLTYFTPAIIAIVDGIRKLIDAHPEVAATIMGSMAAAATALGVAFTVSLTASAFTGAITGFTALAKLAVPIAALAAAVSTLVWAFGELDKKTSWADKFLNLIDPTYADRKARASAAGRTLDQQSEVDKKSGTGSSPYGALTPYDRRNLGRGRGGSTGAAPGGGTPSSSDESSLTGLINKIAIEEGVDPRVMQGIRAGESLHREGWYDKKDDAVESSWGPFQLNRRRGLGVQFEKETGLDLRDPATIPDQTRWVAKYLAKGGSTRAWMGYHGPRDADPRWGNSGYKPTPKAPSLGDKTRSWIPDLSKMPISPGQLAPKSAGGANTHNESNSSVSVGAIHVHSNATNPEQLVADIKPAIEANSFAVHANYGIS